LAQLGRTLAAVAAHGAVTVLLVPAIVAPTTLMPTSAAYAQCPEQIDQHFIGAGTTACPCFVPGEEAGAVFTAPKQIAITKIGIGWGSTFGGQGQTIEQAIHVYGVGLPNPGVPIFSLLGPQLTDGVINEFTVEALNWIVPAGDFSVTIEFLNESASNFFQPATVHDGNGCTGGGVNLVKAIPGGWNDACLLGVTGDWIFYVKYKDCSPTGIGEERIASNVPVYMRGAAPNPFTSNTQLEFFLQDGGNASVIVYDVRGRAVAELANRYFPPGMNYLSWDGSGGGLELSSGVYFVELRSGAERSTQKVMIKR